jgi:hypothetical protein
MSERFPAPVMGRNRCAGLPRVAAIGAMIATQIVAQAADA